MFFSPLRHCFPRWFRPDYRLNILIHECLFLGFLVGFLSVYHHFPYMLLCLLLMHIFGTIITEKRIDRMKSDVQSFSRWSIDVVRTILRQLFNSVLNRLSSRSSSVSPKKIKMMPKEWLYNYHLKPTKDLRLERVRTDHWSSAFDHDEHLVASGSDITETWYFQSPRNDLLAQCPIAELSITEQFLSTTATWFECKERLFFVTRDESPFNERRALTIDTFSSHAPTMIWSFRLFWIFLHNYAMIIVCSNPNIGINLSTPPCSFPNSIPCIPTCWPRRRRQTLLNYSNVWSTFWTRLYPNPPLSILKSNSLRWSMDCFSAPLDSSIIKQVHNRQLTTVSLTCLNKLFVETDAEVGELALALLASRFLLSLSVAKGIDIRQSGQQSSRDHPIRGCDVVAASHPTGFHHQTYLLRSTSARPLWWEVRRSTPPSSPSDHLSMSFRSSQVRFRAEPFQILTLPVQRTDTTLERLLFQLTKIELVWLESLAFVRWRTIVLLSSI